ncbi:MULTISPECIES: hypothetical protein [Prauserella salsuginis group]|uniref:DUF3307 domain-containing protein n=1 Tax=Prauserella salsuginis TaxID=387889 RepID=A0ABW6G2E0_9PSEU|nr:MULTISPECIES: hypothetical protein [Prauserella salsuginis group]MCR3719914.1 hypothetical protein [Prauserella flava]MCR3736543.1 hypothetical protein [Prauserella salsuginis]
MATVDELMTLATFAASGVVLLVGHNLADHVTGQCDWQAANKGAPKPEEVAAGASPHRGWLANLAHVGQYHLSLLVLGFLAWLVLPLHWSAPGVVSALAWSAGTHALLDRRWPVRWLLERTGSPDFARLNAGGLNGMYAADQALHGLALGVSAVLLAVL